MRALLILLLSLGVAAAAQPADAVTGRIIKVLPLLLDLQGRTATSPSLFDRDAYQAILREQATNVSAVRFDVLWKAAKAPDEKFRIAVELRGIGTNSIPRVQTLETNVVPGAHSQWTAIPLAGQAYKDFGRVVAWRVTLWNDGQLLGEQKSFLW
ncbi:MAG TPA: hypothetical protein VL970_08930 [Candidatus Acidoferrales bacterium]|nr:hypothetical protein [Candidatus Acidoferrales bacterium]